ncbi:MaoC family dehydratase [Blastococcus saxobsidens]|uniref:Acyl dehydratase n=1 Tax=Blastococcus saxobsidens TaxID=138336 RepID=A0A4Q7YAD2_9ACTN|nr:MaoC family dehydratase [Blastococcus saxobsidens]RZU34147.1 acyl dehydratase [Blastococcus saxobsidens]
MSTVDERLTAEGPWFEELRVGQVLHNASGLTLTEGLAATHQSIVGDRLRIALDHEFGRRVTGQDRPPAAPSLVWDVSIGQSTSVTHHVVANLFYRGLAFRRLPSLGDTLYSRTEVVALRQNTVREGRPATGLAALRITTSDQEGRPVLDYWRCAMLPLRDQGVRTGAADDLALVGTDAVAADPGAWGWDLAAVGDLYGAAPGSLLEAGRAWSVTGGDVVSSAPELARLTLNVARAHHDDASSASGRLVYGGHTIGVALSQVTRAFPDILTVLSWRHCDHLGPVREGDTLASVVDVEGTRQLPAGRAVDLRSRVTARSVPGEEPRPVLDWRFTALFP